MNPQMYLGNFTLRFFISLLIFGTHLNNKRQHGPAYKDKTVNTFLVSELKDTSQDKTCNLSNIRLQGSNLPSDVWYASFLGLKNHNRLCFKEHFHAHLSIIGQGATLEIPMILSVNSTIFSYYLT